MLRRNRSLLLPGLQVRQQILNQCTVCLILDWRFEPPFVIPAPYFYLFVAILNDDTVDFAAIEVDHVLCLPPGLLRTRLFHLKESEISEHAQHNHSED